MLALCDLGLKNLIIISNVAGISITTGYGWPKTITPVDQGIFFERKQVKKIICSFPVPGSTKPISEIEKSWNAGATMVKVFPASQMGPDYFKTVRGPFDKLLLMAVGGIKVSDATKYLQAGASAVAIGGSVFTPSRIKNKEFESIKSEISKFVSAIKMFYS